MASYDYDPYNRTVIEDVYLFLNCEEYRNEKEKESFIKEFDLKTKQILENNFK